MEKAMDGVLELGDLAMDEVGDEMAKEKKERKEEAKERAIGKESERTKEKANRKEELVMINVPYVMVMVTRAENALIGWM